jgi:hypothetical protein
VVLQFRDSNLVFNTNRQFLKVSSASATLSSKVAILSAANLYTPTFLSF